MAEELLTLTRENQGAGEAVWLRLKVVVEDGVPYVVDANTGLLVRVEGCTATQWHTALRPGNETAQVALALDGVPVEYV